MPYPTEGEACATEHVQRTAIAAARRIQRIVARYACRFRAMLGAFTHLWGLELEPLEPRPERRGTTPHASHRVADGIDPRPHRLHREGLGLHRRDLVPPKRCRDARVRRRPHRVSGGDRPVTSVL